MSNFYKVIGYTPGMLKDYELNYNNIFISSPDNTWNLTQLEEIIKGSNRQTFNKDDVKSITVYTLEELSTMPVDCSIKLADIISKHCITNIVKTTAAKLSMPGTPLKPPCCNITYREEHKQDFLQRAIDNASNPKEHQDNALSKRIANSIVVKTSKNSLEAETNFVVAFLNKFDNLDEILVYSKDMSETFLDEIETHFELANNTSKYVTLCNLYILQGHEIYYVGRTTQDFSLEAVEHITKLSGGSLVEVKLPYL